MKKLKKNDFVIFDPKKSWSRLGLGWISGTPVKIVKKWLNYLVLGMFFDKVKKFCDHSMILWEMAGNLLTSGSFWHPPGPPASFRAKAWIGSLIMIEALLQMKQTNKQLYSHLCLPLHLTYWYVSFFYLLFISNINIFQ